MLNVQVNKPYINSRKRKRGDIKDPKTFEIADRFQKYQRKTTENILEMCRIVVEAKDRDDFDDFCLLIGYDRYSSTIRKLHSIGLKYSHLISISDRLPPNWTVLYEISRMDDGAIVKYVENNSISPLTSTSKIEKLLIEQNLKSHNQTTSAVKRSTQSQSVSQNVPFGTAMRLGFTAELSSPDLASTLFDLDEVLKDLRRMGFEVTVSEQLQQAINDSKTLELEMEVSQ